MRRIAVPTSTIRALLRYATVALTALTLVSTGPLKALVTSATLPYTPEPLVTSRFQVADSPLSFYLSYLDGPGWASDSDGFTTRAGSAFTLQPPPVFIDDVPFVPYRLHEFIDAVAVELPSANGRQVLVLNRNDLSSTIYTGNAASTLSRIAVQHLAFEAFREQASTSAPLTLEQVDSAHAWEDAAVSDVVLSVTTGNDRITVHRTFILSLRSGEYAGSVDAVFGFNGVAGVNSWTYRIDAAPNAPRFRLYASTNLDGTVASEHEGDLYRYHIATPDTAPQLDLGTPTLTPTPLDEAAPTGTPTPTRTEAVQTSTAPSEPPAPEPGDLNIDSVPVEELVPEPLNGSPVEPFVPAPEVPLEVGPTSLLERVRAFLAPSAFADEATPTPEPSAEPTLTPELTPADTPTPEPTLSEAPAPEPTPTQMVTPESSVFPSATSSLEPTPEPTSDTLPVVTPEPPSVIQKAWDWLQGLVGTGGGTMAVLVMGFRDNHGPVEVIDNGAYLIMTSETADTATGDAAFFADATFGVQFAAAGITVTSGDGTGTSDFRLHFNPVLGGTIDELFTGADFTTNKVAHPASTSGALTLVNIGSYAQTAHFATLSLVESSAARVIVQSEIDLTATGSAPAVLLEQYVIYPSGRIVKTTHVTVDEPTTITAFFDSSATALDAGYTDTEEAGQLYLSDTGPDLMMYWQELPSAAVRTDVAAGSRVASYDIPVSAGQTTWHQYIELTKDDVNPAEPGSYRPYADDMRSPGEPSDVNGGIFSGYDPAHGAYAMEALAPMLEFRLGGDTIVRIAPAFELTGNLDGSPAIGSVPSLTVRRDGETLVSVQDYRLAITGTSGGNVSIVLQYFGTVSGDATFSVEGFNERFIDLERSPCHAQPFSQTLPRGGNVTFDIVLKTVTPGATFTLSAGELPYGITAEVPEPHGVAPTTTKIRFDAQPNAQEGSLSIVLLYEELSDANGQQGYLCQLNLITE